MTKEEILAMDAGRTLDGLVAKEIMDIEVEHPYGKGFPYHLAENTGGQKVWDAINFYSTDILAAWQVVEKSKHAWDIKRRYRPHPDDPPMSSGRATYQVIVIVTEFENIVETSQKTIRSPWCWSLPAAICIAALLAKLEAN